ncbi:MAG TPA: hypothetical protein VLP43_09470 [Solirubrobacteraceae bacterium]|nr:hypothetical protein [Solirubrobacteraceae bacterium]
MLAISAVLSLARPQPAAAFNILNPVCTVAGAVSGIAGKACKVAQNSGRILQAGKKLLGGHLGGAVKALSSPPSAGASTRIAFATGLVVFGGWIAGGAHAALRLVADVISRSTRPQLRSTWFSSTYWRVAGIAALLTLPFLFAAAIQALLRSDLSLLLRAALGYLPLALLAVSVAAPLTMLLLSATDAMSGAVSAAAGHSASHFLARMTAAGTSVSLLSKSPFLACFLAVLVVAVSVVLWLEMLVRDAAIYVVVLMLPLIFATLVWPARRVWATRTAELLFALILSKFAIVAVLSLGGAAAGSAGLLDFGQMTLGLVLVGLGATAPWVLMRLLPVTELASSLHGMRSPAQLSGAQGLALESGVAGHSWADALPELMRGAEGSTSSEQTLANRTAASGEELQKFDSAAAEPPKAEAHVGAAPEPEAGAMAAAHPGLGAPDGPGADAGTPAGPEAPARPVDPPHSAPVPAAPQYTKDHPVLLGFEAQGAPPATEPPPPDAPSPPENDTLLPPKPPAEEL